MIYGKRQHFQNRQFRTGHAKFITQKFQIKYISFMAIVGAGISAIFMAPALWFVQKNYQLVSSIAYQYQPGLLQHLDHEVTWLYVFLIVSTLVMTAAVSIFTWKVTNEILKPIHRLDFHMSEITNGNWTKTAPSPAGEDLRELLVTYDSLYRTLKTASQHELNLLAKLRVHPKDSEAYRAWIELMNHHRQKLGLEPIDFSALSVAAEPGRRAS